MTDILYLLSCICKIAEKFIILYFNEKLLFYHDNVTRSVLDGTKQAQDDHDDVKKVDHDGSPLVSEEVKHLPLHSSDLEGQHDKNHSLKAATEKVELLKMLCLLQKSVPDQTVWPWLTTL